MVFKTEKSFYNLYRIDFKIFVSVYFVFSLNFSLILIFGHIKAIWKALFSRFCLLEIIVQCFITLMAKSEVYNVFVSKLKHFENDIHFCQDVQYMITSILNLIMLKVDYTNIWSTDVYILSKRIDNWDQQIFYEWCNFMITLLDFQCQ